MLIRSCFRPFLALQSPNAFPQKGLLREQPPSEDVGSWFPTPVQKTESSMESVERHVEYIHIYLHIQQKQNADGPQITAAHLSMRKSTHSNERKGLMDHNHRSGSF